MRYKLQDLIDIEHFQNLQDRLNKICSFPSSIIDNDGNILTATAWQDICTRFHRKNKDCEKLCIKSDQYIKDHIYEANPAVSYRCPHGLVDNATPIIIDGIHYGNFFTGQFFLEKPDLKFFRAQAQKYGFDEAAYIKAVKKVPIWTQEQLENYLVYIKGLISVICESGIKKLQEIENRKQIQKSEKRYRSILKAAMDGYWITDTTGRLLEVNDAYCRMSGYSEDELLTMCIPDLEAVENDQAVAERMQKIMFKGSDRFETRHRKKDGTVFNVEVSIQFRPVEGGECVCFLRDITERKQADNAIQISEKKYRTLFKHMAHGVFYQRADGVLIDYNNAVLEMFGLTADQFIGRTSLDPQWKVIRENGTVLTGDKHPSMVALQTGKPVKDAVVGVYSPLKKEYSWLVVNAIPQFKKTEKKPYQAFVTLQDITERKKAEKALLSSETQLRILINTIPDLVWLKNPNGVYLSCNQAFERFFGAKEQSIVGRTDYDFVDKDLAVFFRKHDRKAMKSDKPSVNEEWLTFSDDGYYGLFETIKTPMHDNDGKLIGVLGIARDITERKNAEKEKEKLEQELRQAQKMEAIGRLAGGVAHDFNNMLSIILGNTEIVLEDLEKTDPLISNLKEIYNAAERSTNLTRQLLAFARKQTIEPKVLDLNKVIENMIKMLNRLIGEDIDLAWLPSGQLWRVKIDPSQIDQIMANLCINARDAIQSVGKVTIETDNVSFDEAYCRDHPGFKSGDYIMIAFTDNGGGMDEDTLDNLFEPFFTTKKMGEGTGLGLATIYGIVKQNKGFINVYSEADLGTTFKLYFPRHAKIIDAKIHKLKNTIKTGNETILLVEDEPSILRMTSMMLKRMGYNVLEAPTPVKALELARKYPDSQIDLLITDVVMPEMNGRDLSEKILVLYPDIKCLFMSGYTANVIAHHGVLDEGIQFINKPFTRQNLSKKIRRMLDEPEK